MNDFLWWLGSLALWVAAILTLITLGTAFGQILAGMFKEMMGI